MKPIRIKVADIVVGERLRNVNAPTVTSIAKSFQELGQLSPIIVWRNDAGQWVLAAGEHRVEAAKKCAWDYIDALPMDTETWGDDEWHAIQARKIEVDENMQRKNLDYAETLAFRYERVHIVDREHAWLAPKIEAAEDENAARDAEAAAAREREAAAALAKAEADENAKAKAEALAALEAVEAEKQRIAAVRELQRQRDYNREVRRPCVKSELANADLTQMPDRKPGEHGLMAAAQAAASRAGGNAVTLRDAVKRVEALGGLDEIKSLTGTTLATQAEITSIAVLRKNYPKEAQRLLALARAGKNVSAQATLGGLTKEANDTKRSQDFQALQGDKTKSASRARRELAAVLAATETLKKTLRQGGLTDDLAECTRMTTNLMAMDHRLSQYRNVATAKPNGTERKYTSTTTPADTEARAKAKKQQAANSKVSGKSLKKK